MTGQEGVDGLALAAGPSRYSRGRVWRHGRLKKGREQEGFLLPVFFCCGLQAVERHGAKRETMSLGDGFDSLSEYFAHLSLVVKIIALATIYNIMKY
ncbi:hypothetical protein [Desulfovibrio sp.]|uniref:hypothetical protein n=1 Tax=Desulfovibrio sp. TaxID=885 RepID=UPI002A805B35|nr:hypothetical protein [Desulfovibrio sp.]